MTAFCTYCSAEKDASAGLLPAIERYLSDRIDRIKIASLYAGCGFFILSGEYGLIGDQEPIPYYDHLLAAGEVDARARQVRAQLEELGIAQLVFFTVPLSEDPTLGPYHECLRRACREASVPLTFIEIDFA